MDFFGSIIGIASFSHPLLINSAEPTHSRATLTLGAVPLNNTREIGELTANSLLWMQHINTSFQYKSNALLWSYLLVGTKLSTAVRV